MIAGLDGSLSQRYRCGGWEEGRCGGGEGGRGGGGGGWRDQHLVDLSWRFGSSEGGGWEAEEEGKERRRVTNMYVLSSRSRERPSLMS